VPVDDEARYPGLLAHVQLLLLQMLKLRARQLLCLMATQLQKRILLLRLLLLLRMMTMMLGYPLCSLNLLLLVDSTWHLLLLLLLLEVPELLLAQVGLSRPPESWHPYPSS
jgi:hypothetical protein